MPYSWVSVRLLGSARRYLAAPDLLPQDRRELFVQRLRDVGV
jgi:hypothetical protein